MKKLQGMNYIIHDRTYLKLRGWRLRIWRWRCI